MQDAVEFGAIVNTSPRPRMLIMGFEGESDLVDRITELCPTVRRIEGLHEVRHAEWDLLVTDQGIATVGNGNAWLRLAPHIGLIYRAPMKTFQAIVEGRREWSARIGVRGGLVSQEIRRVKNLPDRVESLVHELLEPVLTVRDRHQYFDYTNGDREGLPTIAPFVVSPDGHVLAGRYRRSDESEAWLLPHDVPEFAEWVIAALGEWHLLAPERFPGVPDWAKSKKWMTSDELRIVEGMEEVRRRRTAALAGFDSEEADLARKLADARDRADGYERALLTSQSDELKFAVLKAFEELGFEVEDADLSADSGDHLEDLHIGDPDVSDWVCLGEVKGYTKGAKTEGLTQFIRFNMRYMQRTGKAPNACWYIVNQFAKRDPSRRQPALHGKDEDLRAFGAANGLVVDTVDLFKLLRAVREGNLTPTEARTLLRASRGRFTMPTQR